MEMFNKNLAKKMMSVMIATGIATASISSFAETTGYNQVSFSAEAKQEVANDEVQASMYKKVQAKSAKALATELNSAMNTAMRIAKRYPTVKVSTGQQHTYPQYDKKSKIIGWTGQSNINIKSIDLVSASQLIADLQENLVLDNLSFGVSENRQDELNKKLMTQVSKNFQQQADTLSLAWGAKSYRLIKVDLNTGGNYYERPIPMMTKSAFSTEAVPEPNFEAGNSTITVTANGTIELMK